MVEHFSNIGIIGLAAVVIHEGAVQGEDVAAEVYEIIGRQFELAPQGHIGTDIGFEAPLRRNVLVSFEQGTDTAHTTVKRGSHAGYEASRPGVVLLIKETAIGLEPVNAHIGIRCTGKAHRAPYANVVFHVPAQQQAGIEGIPVTRRIGIAAKQGKAQRGIKAVVIIIGNAAAVVDVAVFPIVEGRTVAVEIRDMGRKGGSQMVPAKGSVPSQDNVALHPALLTGRPVTVGTKIGGHVRSLGNAAKITGVRARLGRIAYGSGIEGEAFLQIETRHQGTQVFPELEVGLQDLGPGRSPTQPGEGTHGVVGMGGRSREVGNGIRGLGVVDRIDIGRIRHDVVHQRIDAVVGTGAVFQPAPQVYAHGQDVREFHVQVGSDTIFRKRDVLGAVCVFHIQEALLVGIVQHNTVLGL